MNFALFVNRVCPIHENCKFPLFVNRVHPKHENCKFPLFVSRVHPKHGNCKFHLFANRVCPKHGNGKFHLFVNRVHPKHKNCKFTLFVNRVQFLFQFLQQKTKCNLLKYFCLFNDLTTITNVHIFYAKLQSCRNHSPISTGSICINYPSCTQRIKKMYALT